MFVTHDNYVAACNAAIDLCSSGVVTTNARDTILASLHRKRHTRCEHVAVVTVKPVGNGLSITATPIVDKI